MSIADRCAAVIPCLNEAAAIAGIVTGALRHVPAVIVIDDGSTDETADVARQAGGILVRHERSRGKGSALNTGFRQARAQGYEWAIALDGDGQHGPEEIPCFLAAAEDSRARMIVGNRMAAPAAMPVVRRWVNRWMSRGLSGYCGLDWPDSQCGFRLVHLETWSTMEFKAEHFEIESELLVRFAAAGHPIEFIPIETRYAGERSRIRPIRDSIRWFSWWYGMKRELASTPEPLPNLTPQVSAWPSK